jgi:hypothetical protein
MGTITHEDIDRKNGVFNFGSFFFGPFFLLFNGKIKEGLIWLFGLPILSIILNIFIGGSLVNILMSITYLLFLIYYTSIGNEILWYHKNCKSIEDFRKVNRIWNILSIGLCILYLVSFYLLYF